jgi:hypothetical protein
VLALGSANTANVLYLEYVYDGLSRGGGEQNYLRRIKEGRQKSESETYSLLRDCESQIHEKKRAHLFF